MNLDEEEQVLTSSIQQSSREVAELILTSSS